MPAPSIAPFPNLDLEALQDTKLQQLIADASLILEIRRKEARGIDREYLLPDEDWYSWSTYVNNEAALNAISFFRLDHHLDGKVVPVRLFSEHTWINKRGRVSLTIRLVNHTIIKRFDQRKNESLYRISYNGRLFDLLDSWATTNDYIYPRHHLLVDDASREQWKWLYTYANDLRSDYIQTLEDDVRGWFRRRITEQQQIIDLLEKEDLNGVVEFCKDNSLKFVCPETEEEYQQIVEATTNHLVKILQEREILNANLAWLKRL